MDGDELCQVIVAPYEASELAFRLVSSSGAPTSSNAAPRAGMPSAAVPPQLIEFAFTSPAVRCSAW